MSLNRDLGREVVHLATIGCDVSNDDNQSRKEHETTPANDGRDEVLRDAESWKHGGLLQRFLRNIFTGEGGPEYVNRRRIGRCIVPGINNPSLTVQTALRSMLWPPGRGIMPTRLLWKNTRREVKGSGQIRGSMHKLCIEPGWRK